MAAKVDKGVTLYTAAAPNGWKVSILLKLLKYPHVVKPVDMSLMIQKEPWFLAINPNGRIPAIVDHDNDDFPVFESGACMIYLAEKANRLYPQEWNKRHEVNQWLFFMNSGVGPMMGQSAYFQRYAPVDIPYAKDRYVKESERLYAVMDARLRDRDWLAAGELTIADVATFGWIFATVWARVDLQRFPALKHWADRVATLPEVQEGLDVPHRRPDYSGPDANMLIEKGRKFMVSTEAPA